MACKPACIKTASYDGAGHRIMVSVEGNKKYPAAHTPHNQCDECLREEVEEMKNAFILGPGMAEKWENLLAKTKKVLEGSK